MSAMFAGASRALLTSIIFAVETTAQSNAMLPLLSACIASYFISFFLLKNTIMTEKIARRGVKTPDSYEPDILETINVHQQMNTEEILINEENKIGEVIEWLKVNNYTNNYFLVVNDDSALQGFVSTAELYNNHGSSLKVNSLKYSNVVTISAISTLRDAVGLMAKEGLDVLPVTDPDNKHQLSGVLSYKNIIAAYKRGHEEHQKNDPNISLKRKRLRILVKGQQIISSIKVKKS
jgi:predicted transcriptional regulator